MLEKTIKADSISSTSNVKSFLLSISICFLINNYEFKLSMLILFMNKRNFYIFICKFNIFYQNLQIKYY